MRKTICVTLLITAVSMTAAGCASLPSCCIISPPRIHLTGEKTAIERQIVGEYRELEDDAWVISSMKTSVATAEGLTPSDVSDREILKAMKIREYNSDNIKRYKKIGAIGEDYNGFASYRPSPEVEGDTDEKAYVKRLVNEENSARRTIFTRTLYNINKREPSPDEIQAFGKLFAAEQRALAERGDWIQDDSGRWREK